MHDSYFSKLTDRLIDYLLNLNYCEKKIQLNSELKLKERRKAIFFFKTSLKEAKY